MDQYVETTTTSWGTRIKNSFSGIILGLILFFASFAVLYWNEGRSDISLVAKKAIEIDSQKPVLQKNLENKLVVTTGIINSPDKLTDNLFLKPESLLALERIVEIYSWKEQISSKSKVNLGGSETVENTYTYSKQWSSYPEDSSKFKYKEGHVNPEKKIKDFSERADKATIGLYNIIMREIMLPDLYQIPLTQENIKLTPEARLISNNYIYIPAETTNSYENPSIGDLRINYKGLKTGIHGTIFGKLVNNNITSYFYDKDNQLYRIFLGSKDEAIKSMRAEYTTLTWILRLLGFIMMWIGLILLLGPIPVILDAFPLLGSLGRGLISILSFIVALVLTIITVLISMLLHNIYILIIAVVITLFGFYKLFKRRQERIQTTRNTDLKK